MASIGDMPTTILEAREIWRKPTDYTGSPTAIRRTLCQSRKAIQVSAMAANI
jgi:hypothetical protein